MPLDRNVVAGVRRLQDRNDAPAVWVGAGNVGDGDPELERLPEAYRCSAASLQCAADRLDPLELLAATETHAWPPFQ
jgi:hypothetical protein